MARPLPEAVSTPEPSTTMSLPGSLPKFRTSISPAVMFASVIAPLCRPVTPPPSPMRTVTVPEPASMNRLAVAVMVAVVGEPAGSAVPLFATIVTAPFSVAILPPSRIEPPAARLIEAPPRPTNPLLSSSTAMLPLVAIAIAVFVPPLAGLPMIPPCAVRTDMSPSAMALRAPATLMLPPLATSSEAGGSPIRTSPCALASSEPRLRLPPPTLTLKTPAPFADAPAKPPDPSASNRSTLALTTALLPLAIWKAALPPMAVPPGEMIAFATNSITSASSEPLWLSARSAWPAVAIPPIA